MKTAETKLQKTRRDVPQTLGLIRASTRKQDVERQHADLDWLEIRYGIQISERLVIEGLSGKDTLHDPDVQKILKRLADPHIAGLAISAVDRLVRPGEGDFTAYSIFQPFVPVHKPIWSKREGFIEPWTAEGHDICVDAAKKARSERLELRRRSMDEKLVLAKIGVQTSATAAYGYRFAKAERRRGTWVIYEPEAAVVRKIFSLAAMGYTGYRIAFWLNKLGEFAEREGARIPSATGKFWNDGTVRQLMRNSSYIGEGRYAHRSDHAVVIPVPAILKTEQERAWWDAAQMARATNLEKRSGRPSSAYLLQSLIYCGRCGGRLTGIRESGNRRSYGCFARNRTHHKRICFNPQIPCAKLDEAIYGALLTQLGTRATIEKILKSYRDQLNASTGLGASRSDRLAKLKRDEQALNRKLSDGDLLHLWEQTKRELLGVRSEIATIEREASKAANVFVMPNSRAVDIFLKVVEAARHWTEYRDRRDFVEAAVVKISYADNEYVVEGRIAFADSNASVRKHDPQNPYRGLGSTTGFVPFVFSGKVAA